MVSSSSIYVLQYTISLPTPPDLVKYLVPILQDATVPLDNKKVMLVEYIEV